MTLYFWTYFHMLNIITDPWIPVRRASGPDVIRPDQIAEADVLFPDWPRADLNLACLELLIGLVYLAAPPKDISDWTTRQPDAEALRVALAPLAPAFNLLGKGPLFLQDFDEGLTSKSGSNQPDMLFIDSAGDSTAKKNADLMVKRARYPELPLNLAAMALYTLQNFAPSGGRGNRTSTRGGGPMVTLVKPKVQGADQSLWSLIWANVPEGEPFGPDDIEELPWMRSTKTSQPKNGQVTVPPGDGTGAPHPEVFFGQPRRLRLVADGDLITGVIQAPWGTNYNGWIHPLSPYYHVKNKKLPKHPEPGIFGYRNWRGIVLQSDGADLAHCLYRFRKHRGEPCDLLVGGWAMGTMSPLDFLWSEAPVFTLDADGEALAGRLVEAAKQVGYALAFAVKTGKGEDNISSGCGARVQQAFFVNTQTAFEAHLGRIMAKKGGDETAAWLKEMRRVALGLFDGEVMPGMADISETRRRGAVAARKDLLGTFRGDGTVGKKIFTALDLPLPKQTRKPKAEATT